MHMIEVDLEPLRPFVEQVIRETAVEGLGALIDAAVHKALRKTLGGLLDEPEQPPPPARKVARPLLPEKFPPQKRGRGRPRKEAVAEAVASVERKKSGRPSTLDKPAIAKAVHEYLAMGMATTTDAVTKVAKERGISGETVRRAYKSALEAGDIVEGETQKASTTQRGGGDTRAFWGLAKRLPAASDMKVKKILDAFNAAPDGTIHTMQLLDAVGGLKRTELQNHIKRLIERGAMKKSGTKARTIYTVIPKRAAKFYEAYVGEAHPGVLNGANGAAAHA